MSGKEKRTDHALKEILARSRRKWRALIDLLLSEPPRPRKSPPAAENRNAEWRKDVDTYASQEPPQPPTRLAGLAQLTFAGPFEPAGAATIFRENERLHQITQLMDRLNRVEKQNHKILVLIFAFTISAFIFLLLSDLFPKNGMFEMAQGISAESCLDAREGQISIAPVTDLVAGKYVGVKAANEYHRPDCRVALTAPLGDLIPLKSAAAAKRQGYKPCPVCRPPNAD